jgi:hypothetical protein
MEEQILAEAQAEIDEDEQGATPATPVAASTEGDERV